MKRLLVFILLVIVLGNASLFGEQITILHLNDTHAHLLPYGPKGPAGVGQWGGMARVASLVGMTKMSEPNVLFFHSGDFSVGDFMFQKYLSIPELEILKQLGCDGAALGNHEFDLYPSTLKYELNEAGFPASGFPVLCANLDMSADPEMAYFVQPYLIKQVGTVKIGIFGLLTEFTNSGSNPAPDVVIPPLDVAQYWVDSLKTGLGCDVVVLLSHLGADMDQLLASSTSGIDVILGGHTHTLLEQPVQIGSTLIVQAGEFAHYLGKLRLDVEGGAISSWDFQLLPVESSVPEEPTLAAMLGGLAAGVEADPRFGPVYSQTVAVAKFDLDKNFGHGICMDNPMGNLIADAFRATTRTDIAIQPQGFINQEIWGGAVTGNDIFQTVPYGFDQTSGLGLKLATFKTTGASLVAGLEFAVYNLPYLEDFFLHISNLTFAYNSKNAPSSRVDITSIRVGANPLSFVRSYTVTVPDGVVPFLAQIPGFQMQELTITDQFMYTVVRNYMSGHSPVVSFREGRILDIDAMGSTPEAIAAISDMINLYESSGAIKRAMVGEVLERQLRNIGRAVDNDRPGLALIEIRVMKLLVSVYARCGWVKPYAATTLSYMLDKLMDVVKLPPTLARTDESASPAAASMPDQFELAQNYPNPFNPSTKIEFSLPAAAYVTITVYNTLGQEVTRLVDEPLSSGRHVVEWNSDDSHGRSVASGVYYYRIAAGDYSATRKMILVK